MPNPPIDKLRSIFEKYPDILAVYLFGSAAGGKIHIESDLDLAIIPRSDKITSKRLDILTKLADGGFCNVDLVILPKDDIVLQYEAVRHNRIVYRRAEFDHGSFYSLVIRRYLDFLPYLTTQRKAYKNRILDGKA